MKCARMENNRRHLKSWVYSLVEIDQADPAKKYCQPCTEKMGEKFLLKYGAGAKQNTTKCVRVFIFVYSKGDWVLPDK